MLTGHDSCHESLVLETVSTDDSCHETLELDKVSTDDSCHANFELDKVATLRCGFFFSEHSWVPDNS